LENGHNQKPYEQTALNYDSWLQHKGFSYLSGRTKLGKIYCGVNEFFGEEFLKLVEAYDKDQTSSWTRRILFGTSKLQHPMYHILFHIMLAGSTAAFLEGREKPLPYGKGPWPCRNPVCPHNLKDVIKEIDMRYGLGIYRATFECPHCGLVYKRKKPAPKEEQYAGSVYIASYGHLWFHKLHECIVEQGLSLRQTCKILKCDMYTVQKYAIKLGYMKPEDATLHLVKRNAKQSTRLCRQ
jgi:hypothetical protein